MIKPILSRIFQGLFFLSFVWIYFSVIFTNSGDEPWIAILVGIAILAIGIGAAYFCKKIVAKWSPKIIHSIFAGIAIIILSLLIYFSFSLKASLIWDADEVYRAATAPLNGEQLADNYFAIYPNNIFILLIFKIFYKVIFAITGSTDIIYIMLLNAVIIFVGIIFMYLISVKLWGPHIGLLTGIVCLFFAPFYVYVAYYYTDTFSLPFITIAIYLYLCAIDSKKKIGRYLLLIGSGFIIALGFKLKATIVILLVAVIIHLFLSQKLRTALKYTGVIAASFIVMFFSYNIVVDQLHIVSEEEAYEKQMPYVHWIMMGLNGNGGYNADDVLYTQSFPNIEEKTAADLSVIKQRLSDYGFNGFINHLTNKAVHNTWGDGTYYIFGEGKTVPETNSKLWEFVLSTGKYYNIFYYYCQGFHLAILTLLMISLLIGIKKGIVNGTLLFKIAIYGLFLFLLIWETRSRYVFGFAPLLLLISVDTCKELVDINFQQLKDKFILSKKRLLSKNKLEKQSQAKY